MLAAWHGNNLLCSVPTDLHHDNLENSISLIIITEKNLICRVLVSFKSRQIKEHGAPTNWHRNSLVYWILTDLQHENLENTVFFKTDMETI